ncbi:hypothetical protein K461DRAFT_70479 [Myriangium duriaei CBS 260.36]|uniref:Zn(2)-C6 fungal-type domain-containing protein n=1 Tax=Myriangium duriaei CBS 260.36 TaxID=1168546 RepID=A0A9P4MHA2_9PEZI|nr:hypothetical protein K461DRAFT_70479 [Myriangium duriaei CBS 260.36]
MAETKRRRIVPTQGSDSEADQDRPHKRQQIGLACNACRRRKSKCSGHRPKCTLCATRGYNCVYEEASEGKQLADLRRAHHQVKDENSDLRDLFKLLKTRPEAEAYSMLNRLRSGDDVSSLMRFAEAGDLTLQSRFTGLSAHTSLLADIPDPNELTHYGIGSAFMMPDSLEFDYADGGSLFPDIASNYQKLSSDHRSDSLFADSPQLSGPSSSASPNQLSSSDKGLLADHHPLYDDVLLTVQPHLWTSVPISRSVMANLISMYLSWSHTIYTVFDERYFVEDLVSGNTNFCSPLLVNATCCLGCVLYTTLDSHARLLGSQFMQCAETLLQAESRPSLTNVAASGILSMVAVLHSKHSLGMNYVSQACQWGRQLGMFHNASNVEKMPHDMLERKMLQAKAVASWGIFKLSATVGLSYPIYPMCPIAPSLPPSLDELDIGCPRTLWPSTRQLGYPVSSYSHFCELASITNDCIIFRQRIMEYVSRNKTLDENTSLKTALYLVQKLVSWKEKLPHGVKVANNCLPAGLDLLMTPHSLILEVLRLFATKYECAAVLYANSVKWLTIYLSTSRNSWGGPPNFIMSCGLLLKGASAALQMSDHGPRANRLFLDCVEMVHEIANASDFLSEALFGLLTKARDVLYPFPERAQFILDELEAKNSIKNTNNDSAFIVDLDIAQKDPTAGSLSGVIKKDQQRKLAQHTLPHPMAANQ